jgi:hypothetical protein
VKTTDQLCAEIELRLVDGRPTAEDPVVAAHLRSCLRCFRTASELREVPQLAALLRQGREDEQPDPGELFWARFPRTVADAWERRQQKAAPQVGVWRRVGGLFRLPLPAALAGAAVAAVLVLALVRRTDLPPVSHLVSVPAAAPAPEVAPDEEGTASLLGDDDPLDVLDLADPKVVARMTARAEDEAVGADEGSDLGPSPAEELESLETDDLRAVAQALRGRSQI